MGLLAGLLFQFLEIPHDKKLSNASSIQISVLRFLIILFLRKQDLIFAYISGHKN